MYVVVQIAEKDHAKAVGILSRHSPGTALRDRTFVISDEAVVALRQAGVELTIVSRQGEAPKMRVPLGGSSGN